MIIRVGARAPSTQRFVHQTRVAAAHRLRLFTKKLTSKSRISKAYNRSAAGKREKLHIYVFEIPKLCAPEARLTPEGDEEVVPPHLRSEDS